MRVALSKLTKPELQDIIKNANFTEDELMVFQFLSKGCQLCYIADTMSLSVSSVKRIINKIVQKTERIDFMAKFENNVPIWQKVTMTVDEASAYSNIGVSTIRKLANDPMCSFVLTVGNRKLIKRKEFDKFIEKQIEI